MSEVNQHHRLVMCPQCEYWERMFDLQPPIGTGEPLCCGKCKLLCQVLNMWNSSGCVWREHMVTPEAFGCVLGRMHNAGNQGQLPRKGTDEQ